MSRLGRKAVFENPELAIHACDEVADAMPKINHLQVRHVLRHVTHAVQARIHVAKNSANNVSLRTSTLCGHTCASC